MIIPDRMRKYRLIPLQPYTKKASKPWANDIQYNLDDHSTATGYAIDTERSNLIVIDCDVKDDLDGIGTYLDLATTESGNLPSTFTVESASGGLHFYYNNPTGAVVKSSVSKLGPGIDVRAKGGYIVGPGSTVKLEDGSEGTYTMEDPDAPIEDAPEWLLALLIEKGDAAGRKSPTDDKPSTKQKPSSSKAGARSEAMTPERKIALSWAEAKVKEAREGTRQSTLNTVSYFMGAKRVPESKARELIDLAVGGGLPVDEAERTFSRGYGDGLKEEELTFEQVVTSYNIRTGIASMNDPLDTGYYAHHNLARNFYEERARDFLFWSVNESWYAYVEDEGRWVRIGNNEMFLHMDTYLDDLVIKIRTKHPKITSAILRQQEKLWNKAFVEQVTGSASWAFMNTNEQLFDADRNLINCKNGIVNLKNGELLPHDRERYIIGYIPVEYHPDATDEYCDKLLESVPDDSREFLQLFAGQSLTGHQPSTQVALFLHGRGSNGKSTFLDLMMKTSGDYGRLQAPSVLLSEKNGGDKFALSDIEGLRLAVVEELPNAKVLDTTALKRLVGTSSITSRRLYENNRSFTNQATVFVTCNRLPMINETGDGAWRRVVVISFPYSYKKTKAAIKGVNDRLGSPRVLYAAQNRAATAEAFLAWRVKGAVRWFKNVMAEAELPSEVERTTQEWNENNDIMLSWFNNTFTTKNQGNTFVTMEDLWLSYNEYATGRGNTTVSMRYFVESFTNHSVFSDNRLVYKKSARVTKNIVRSAYSPLDTSGFKAKPLGEKVFYVMGLAFNATS